MHQRAPMCNLYLLLITTRGVWCYHSSFIYQEAEEFTGYPGGLKSEYSRVHSALKVSVFCAKHSSTQVAILFGVGYYTMHKIKKLKFHTVRKLHLVSISWMWVRHHSGLLRLQYWTGLQRPGPSWGLNLEEVDDEKASKNFTIKWVLGKSWADLSAKTCWHAEYQQVGM